MPDSFSIVRRDGTIVVPARPEPFTYFDLSIGAWQDGDVVQRIGDGGKVDPLYSYRERTWLEWEPPLGAQQAAAYADALAGLSAFITGPGGVGKSETMRRIVRDLRRKGKRVAVTASTGIAAVNVSGLTIHSCLGTGFAGSIKEAQHRTSPEAFTKAADRFAQIDTVLVDETSMLHGDYIEMMSWWMSRIAGVIGEEKRASLPFGGFQVIFVGDFLQLPPVITARDKVKHKYAFQAPSWKKAGLAVHYLRKGYRQDDAEFRKHLMRVRRGYCPQDTLDYFNARVGAKLAGGVKPTRVMSTNAEVERVNSIKLAKLDGEERTYEVKITGHEKWVEAMRNNLVCEEHLYLKVGAEVLFIKNNRACGYMNGTRGRVESLDKGIHVRTYDGQLIDVPRETWEMCDAGGRALASAEQYPLLLAWAVTTHRSQGQTLPYLSYDPSHCFERGQAYVALSRCRSYEGLRLNNPISAAQIRASKLCVDFYTALRT